MTVLSEEATGLKLNTVYDTVNLLICTVADSSSYTLKLMEPKLQSTQKYSRMASASTGKDHNRNQSTFYGQTVSP